MRPHISARIKQPFFYDGVPVFILVCLVIAILCFAGWVQHLYTCFTTDNWGFLIAGAIAFPIAIVHGWGIWFGLW
jgi:hypothetical protein